LWHNKCFANVHTMPDIKNIIPSAIIAVLWTAQPIAAISQVDMESVATRWARETGDIAGGATFCEFDAEILESYKNRAMARIAAEAADDVDLVVSNIAFSNALAASAAKEPEGGCTAFTSFFNRSAARLD
jgi:hypothetical protein